MVVLIVLFVSWLIFRGVGMLGVGWLNSWQASACYGLAVMFVFTGVAHFVKIKHELVRMVPQIFPRPMLMVYVTGVFELLGAIGLALPRFRAVAGICLIILLLAMFPANIRAAQQKMTLNGKPATPLGLRTPMQIMFILLLWWSTQR